MYTQIKVKSRWDYAKIPVETLPSGPLYIDGDDNWFITNKEEIKLQHELADYIEHLFMYGNTKFYNK